MVVGDKHFGVVSSPENVCIFLPLGKQVGNLLSLVSKLRALANILF
jgi:hypothetical protein